MGQGVLTVQEVRYHMDDLCAEKNELIGELEFSDSDIMQAMISCIDYANGAMGGSGHGGGWTVNNLPEEGRFFLKQGTAAQLLQTKAISLLRNTLPYNAGGISIDDQNKSAQYLKMAEPMKADWIMYVGRLHHNRNFRRGFMTLN